MRVQRALTGTSAVVALGLTLAGCSDEGGQVTSLKKCRGDATALLTMSLTAGVAADHQCDELERKLEQAGMEQ